MDNNVKDNKNTRHIARRVHFIRNGENEKMKNIDWCEGGLQLEDIKNKNVVEDNLNPIMRYIMVRLGNLQITLLQEGQQDTGYSLGARVLYN